ncbi:pyridoxamine 5'-phosphate oxidase family protein [Rhodococcus oryzae]|uniref:Pyridoxamine 5'-phosphate oxidase family protein n=1 Tax=Rhodococcus oryzae TaxID=2571143 RepID=A0ABY2RQA3_9NOCA|nr:pyridoxamine 5'-phosphate oxidase family protein [Rhodococcus oryzae]TJZ81249.1 pyridoxamine 5'-phosphate oxidase family protein [Rhodococcus oryzae]
MDKITRHPERSMLDRTKLDAVLDAAAVGTLATVVDGMPWAVPMLYARDGDRIILHGSTGAGALRQVASGAPAALCVALLDGIVVADNLFNSSANYRSAVVRGHLTALTREESADALNALSDALIPGRSAEVRCHTKKELAATLTIALPISAGGWTVKVRDAPPSEPDGDGGAWAGVVPLRTVPGEPIPAPWVDQHTTVPASVRRLAHGAP